MTEILFWAQENSTFVVGAIAVLAVLALSRLRRPTPHTDGQRLFTASQKAIAGQRCGKSRCEHKAPLWFRCGSRGTHGDHIYPHSKGGATTLSNLQLLCPKHNLRKSATVPSALYIWRLERRRARYFPKGVSGRVEWRSGLAA